MLVSYRAGDNVGPAPGTHRGAARRGPGVPWLHRVRPHGHLPAGRRGCESSATWSAPPPPSACKAGSSKCRRKRSHDSFRRSQGPVPEHPGRNRARREKRPRERRVRPGAAPFAPSRATSRLTAEATGHRRQLRHQRAAPGSAGRRRGPGRPRLSPPRSPSSPPSRPSATPAPPRCSPTSIPLPSP